MCFIWFSSDFVSDTNAIEVEAKFVCMFALDALFRLTIQKIPTKEPCVCIVYDLSVRVNVIPLESVENEIAKIESESILIRGKIKSSIFQTKLIEFQERTHNFEK